MQLIIVPHQELMANTLTRNQKKNQKKNQKQNRKPNPTPAQIPNQAIAINQNTLTISLPKLNHTIIACDKCPRLSTYRQEVARQKRHAYQTETYWGKPVPGWGDTAARLLIVGLAPGAHGANRTGRMFTGDKSGEFLYPALYRAGFASQAEGRTPDDGLILVDTYMTNVVHCAPPGNKPSTQELDNCRSYLSAELELLPNLQVILALGKLAFDSFLLALRENHRIVKTNLHNPRPSFVHGAQYFIGPYTLLACYHPSQRNTNTGLLTIPMIDAILQQVRMQLAE